MPCPLVSRDHPGPQLDAESSEVAAERAWVGVAAVECSGFDEVALEHDHDAWFRAGGCAHDCVGQLVVQLAGEALELCGQLQHERGVDLSVDLLVGQRPPSGSGAADADMGLEQLVEALGAFALPALQGGRRHCGSSPRAVPDTA